MSGLQVDLPWNLDGADVCRVVQRFIEACPNGLPAKIIIDFRGLGFIHPAGVTFLSNFIHWLRRAKGVTVDLAGYERLNDAHCFLDDSLFFEQHLGRRLRPNARPRTTTKPLRYVHHEEIHAWLRLDLLPWLAAAVGQAEQDLDPFQVCVSEIFNNISDHSTLDIGSIFVQHFPNLETVRIAVGDFGRGIPALVRTVRPDILDADAIILATEPGFTTKSNPRNQGIGLEYLLTTVVGTNRGRVTIHSLNGHVSFYNLRNQIVHQKLQICGFCPGTTLDITLRTDSIDRIIEEPEELEW